MAAITGSTQQVIEQLERSRGNLANAANALNTSRTTLYKYINEHSTVAAALADIREAMKDEAETMLQERMRTSDTLLIFYLKTQAHERGYVERLRGELSAPDGGPIRTKGEAVIEHRIDGGSAATIFDILAGIGAIQPALDDAAPESLHSPDA